MGGNYPRTADRSAGWQSDAFSISGKRVRHPANSQSPRQSKRHSRVSDEEPRVAAMTSLSSPSRQFVGVATIRESGTVALRLIILVPCRVHWNSPSVSAQRDKVNPITPARRSRFADIRTSNPATIALTHCGLGHLYPVSSPAIFIQLTGQPLNGDQQLHGTG
jgi:hypothetical protein